MAFDNELKTLIGACTQGEAQRNALRSQVTAGQYPYPFADDFLPALRYAVNENNTAAVQVLLEYPHAGGVLVNDKTTENPFYIALKNNCITAANLIDRKAPSQLGRLLVTKDGNTKAIKDWFPVAHKQMLDDRQHAAPARTHRLSQSPPPTGPTKPGSPQNPRPSLNR